MNRYLMPAILILAIVSPARAQQPKVVAVKQFAAIYPASSSLSIPFHGCVALEARLPAGDGEYWLPLDHLVTDDDFDKIQVLVNSSGSIMGARAVFKGSTEEWRGARGYAGRKRVLEVFMGGDGPELSRELPLAYDGNGFGDMVYTFDTTGQVSWRIGQNRVVIREAEYVEGQEKHKRECPECRNLNTAARIVLSRKQTRGQAAPTDGEKPAR